MRPEEKKQFIALLAATATMYDKQTAPQAVELYWQALNDLTLEQIRKGISRHLNDPDAGRFMPKPADIRRHLVGTNHQQAMQAWSKLEEAIRKHGPYCSVVFDDPALSQVVRELGGWIWVCNNADEWMQKEFVTRYEAYLATGGPREAPAKLAGIHDQQNGANGLESPAGTLVLVGEPAKAQARLEAASKDTQRQARQLIAAIKGKAAELEAEDDQEEVEA